MPKDRRPGTRTRTGAEAAKVGKPSRVQRGAKENWIDKVDRVAQRPFLEGDYMPGTTPNRGATSDQCTPPKRRSTGR